MMWSALTSEPFLSLLIPVAFLIGSIPFGIIFTRKRGIDITSTGSRNIGATNVLRTAGKLPAVLTLICDVLKGAVPVLLCGLVLLKMNRPGLTGEPAIMAKEIWLAIVGLSAVLGHMFSIFLSFKGGKGVATGFGVLLAYSPVVAGIALIIWVCAAAISKYSSVGAIASVTAVPFIFILLRASMIKTVFGITMAALIIFKHRSNIRNLVSGAEGRIGEK